MAARPFPLRAAAASDDLHDTVNYAAAFDLVKSEVEGGSRDLIECLSGRIAAGLLREFPTVRPHTGPTFHSLKSLKPEVIPLDTAEILSD